MLGLRMLCVKNDDCWPRIIVVHLRHDSFCPKYAVRSGRGGSPLFTSSASLGSSLLVLFAEMAIVLAATGSTAVMPYSVAQRTNEIGLRLARLSVLSAGPSPASSLQPASRQTPVFPHDHAIGTSSKRRDQYRVEDTGRQSSVILDGC